MLKTSPSESICRVFQQELDALAAPESFYHGGAQSALANIPSNVIVFWGGGDEYQAPPVSFHMRYTLIMDLREPVHCRIDANSYELQPNQALLIFPFQVHSVNTIRNNPNHRRLVISFALPEDDISLAALRNRPFHLTDDDAALIIRLLKLHGSKKKGQVSGIPHLLAFLLNEKLQMQRTAAWRPVDSMEDNPHFGRMIDFIAKNYQKPLSMKVLADHVGLGQTQARKIFKRMGNGLTFGRFIREFRLMRSSELLMHTDWSIGRIASVIGYSDQFSFSRSFKHLFKISPLSYRKQHARQSSPPLSQ